MLCVEQHCYQPSDDLNFMQTYNDTHIAAAAAVVAAAAAKSRALGQNIKHSETSKTRFRLWYIYTLRCVCTHKYLNADGHQLGENANQRIWMAYGAARIHIYQSASQSVSQTASQSASSALARGRALAFYVLAILYRKPHSHTYPSTHKLLTAMYVFCCSLHIVCRSMCMYNERLSAREKKATCTRTWNLWTLYI